MGKNQGVIDKQDTLEAAKDKLEEFKEGRSKQRSDDSETILDNKKTKKLSKNISSTSNPINRT